MSRLNALLACAACVLACSSPADAQVKDRFVEALVQFASAAGGASGDEGPILTEAVEAMADGLQRWDDAVGRVESGFTSEIGGAAPQTAARMRTALGAAYLERGRVAEGLAQFDSAATLDPSFADAHLLRGLASELANRPSAASEAYRTAWQRRPEHLTSAYLVFRAATQAGDASLAEAALKALSSAAERGGQPGTTDAAGFVTVTLLDEASVTAPIFLPAIYSESLTLLRQARFDEAIAHLRKTVRSDPLVSDRALQSPEARVGAAELRSGNAAAAVAALTKAVEYNPESSEVRRLLGMACWMDKRHDAGLAHLRRAVELNPRDERSRLAVADVLFESGDPASALGSLRELTSAIPGSAQGYWNMGRMQRALGDDGGALRSFQAAAALPLLAGERHVHAAIGGIQHNQLDLVGAASAYAKRVDVSPNDAAAHVDLGEVYRAQDRLDEALAEYLIASLLDPTNVKALAATAQLHAAAGRDETAVRLLRRAVALEPAHLEARYGLSRALMRLGFAEEAQKELQVFEQLQAKAMQDERRRFEENQVKIESVLEGGQKEPGR